MSDSLHYENWYHRLLFNPILLCLTILIFIGLAIIVLVKGLNEMKKNQFKEANTWVEENYRGDSLLYGRNIKSDLMKLKVWKDYEPGFCIKWSCLIFILYPFLGLPLVFATVAFFANEYYQVTYKWEKLESTKSKNGGHTSDWEKFVR